MKVAHQMAVLSDYAYLAPQKFIQACKIFTPVYHSVKGTQCYTLYNDDTLVFAFRGTELNLEDIKTDLDFVRTGTPLGSVHTGFLEAYNAIKAKLKIDYDILATGRSVYFTGHSLGAGLATLAMSDLGKESDSLFTFGSPRVGGKEFAKNFNKRFKNSYRYRNDSDLVTREPMALLGFRHVGTSYYYDGAGNLSINPSLAKRLVNYVRGMLKSKTDLITDHSITHYVELTK